MNVEYALVKLLLQNPNQISELAARGFNSKYFKVPDYAKTYDLIFDRYTRFKSLPTNEDFVKIKVEIGDEEVPHTLEHCVNALQEEKRKDLMQKAILVAGSELLANGSEAASDILKSAINKIPTLDHTARSAEASETTDAFLERYHYKALNKGKMLGVPTGFKQIDEHVRGFQKQWFVVVQGRNGMYKSWVLSKMIAHQFLIGKNIAVYSAEMSKEDFTERIYSLCMEIVPRAMSLGELNSGEYNRMHDFLEEVKNGKYGKLYINDAPNNLDNVQVDLDHILEKHPLDILYIDSAYRLQHPGKSDVERFGGIARGCKDIAKKYELPVVVSIQANRDFAKANPTAKKETVGSGMSAYGSDAWNQEADIMWILHRTPDHAPFNFSDFVMDKFRHDSTLDSMLRINLKEPVIEEVDREKAIARMAGENPAARSASESLFTEASNMFKSQTETQTIRYDSEGEDENAS